ncbi:MAG: bifunctional (p)ppGpp synthetase/guanosine-3',5'-bis(diphosphate) 3'-pyrophosphohydrolase [Fimbriimonadales bacterium]
MTEDAAARLTIPADWEDPENLSNLIDELRAQRPKVDANRIRLAYCLAEKAHRGQTRMSGGPYVEHPLAVAKILADLQMDEESVIAGLLHDVLEDSGVGGECIQREFGKGVLALVEGVTKLKFPPIEEVESKKQAAEARARLAETMRKMLMAMAQDFRVMVIKLSDRLHNMQTLCAMPVEKQQRIARETLDIYAPLAGRLGIWQVKWQLEDLAFKYLHQDEYQNVMDLVAKTRKKREEELHEAVVTLKERLERDGFQNFEVRGRPKHLYSVYQKMYVHGFEFDEIYDLLGIRIILEDEGECYRALGIVHELWKPIPGLFYDYIAKPKSNGYQSLHTKVVGSHGEPLEVQIRTHEMHQMAEFGVAAHWQYKPGIGQKVSLEDHARIQRLRQQLLEFSADAETGSDFMRTVSMDLFSEQVFAFTPKGDVLDMPRGATPIDFAFRIHSQVGLRTVGAKVNGRIVKLDHELENGDIVEVMTRRDATPSVDWLKFAKTLSARSKIRAWLRQQNREVNIQRGREAIEREVKAMGFDARDVVTEDKLNAAAASLSKGDAKSLLAFVGEGLISVQRVAAKVTETERKEQRKTKAVAAAPVSNVIAVGPGGVDNIAFKRSKCCLPVPGDETIGYISKGRGVILHRKLCPNAVRLAESDPDRVVSVNWPKDKRPWAVNLRIQTLNRQGLLADITAVLGESKTNVSAATIRTLPNQTAVLDICLDVPDLQHLQSVILKVSQLSDVISVQRTFGGKGNLGK